MSVPRGGVVPLGITLVVPGGGHLYLGGWRRGFVWLVVYAVTLAFFSAYGPLVAGGEAARPFLVSLLRGQIPPTGAVFPLSVIALCLLDVYVLLRYDGALAEEEP